MYHSIDERYYCDWDGLGITNCTHSKDLAVSCRAGKAYMTKKIIIKEMHLI